VSSSGATITLDNGADDNYTIQQSKNYDFDSDKFVELIMQLDSIESGNANMKLVRRIQASNIAGQINIPKEINITAEPTARFQIIAMILFAIGAVLLAFGFYKYQKREELLLGQLKREIKELERGVGKVEKKFGTSNKHAPKRKFHFRK